METLVPEESPLGTYLEGEGEGFSQNLKDVVPVAQHNGLDAHFAPSFKTPITRKARRIIQPILKSDSVSQLRKACAALVNATLGSNDNEHFLEHFRYQIIASQLLSDGAGSVTSPSAQSSHPPVRSPIPELTATTTGACAALALAFTLVWILQWARDEKHARDWAWRGFVASILTFLLVACIWVYVIRRSILYLRRNVIDTTSTFTTNLQSLNSSSSSVLSLIQEVELVSRGYRISLPLPPISRIESTDQPRKAVRLREVLQKGYEQLIPSMALAIEDLRPHVDRYDVDRFLDVYEVRSEDIQDALHHDDAPPVDNQTLNILRLQQTRDVTLRKLLLCSLLALQATGRRADAKKWQLAIRSMENVSSASGEVAQRFIKVLTDEEQPLTPATPISSRRRTISGKDHSPHQSRVESQARRISTLSNGIRSLQAKMFLLREESNRALSGSTSEDELSTISQSLREQYEGLGTDLESLMRAWEAGKQALAHDISKSERRMSQPNSPDPKRASHRSVSSNDSTLAPVSEMRDTFAPFPSHGQIPLSPPVTEDGSEDHSTEDEVFEALSSPRTRDRSSLTREERISKMKEDRERFALAKEKREASTSMVKELQSVIKLRPAIRSRRLNEHERVSSM